MHCLENPLLLKKTQKTVECFFFFFNDVLVTKLSDEYILQHYLYNKALTKHVTGYVGKTFSTEARLATIVWNCVERIQLESVRTSGSSRHLGLWIHLAQHIQITAEIV